MTVHHKTLLERFRAEALQNRTARHCHMSKVTLRLLHEEMEGKCLRLFRKDTPESLDGFYLFVDGSVPLGRFRWE